MASVSNGLRQGLEGEPRKRHYIRLSGAVKRAAVERHWNAPVPVLQENTQ